MPYLGGYLWWSISHPGDMDSDSLSLFFPTSVFSSSSFFSLCFLLSASHLIITVVWASYKLFDQSEVSL